MAVRIVDADITAKVNISQNIKIEVEVTEGVWESAKELLISWNMLKNKFTNWDRLKNW